MKIKPLFKGLATYVPGAFRFRSKTAGGTQSARYCYSVWLRHLVSAQNSGLNTNPEIVAELGPGDSIGIGLAALLSGAKTYFAFDVVAYAASDKNLEIFDRLVALFRQKEDIPGEKEFPKIKPYLDSYAFPSAIFSDDRLAKLLAPKRIERLRKSLIHINTPESNIRYMVPWTNTRSLGTETVGTVDMICSQAVLEHVENLSGTYQAMYQWLRPDGFMSHQIDFKSHGITTEWNGHWAYPDWLWKWIKGRRPYYLNRAPYSTHVRLLEKTGFQVTCHKKIKTPSPIERKNLASQYRYLSDDDLTTSGAFFQAVKNQG
jgi:hypothetical protein